MRSTLLLTAALVAATDARTAVNTNGSCDLSGYTCPSTDCCGVATPVSGTTTKKICTTIGATVWVDTANANAQYNFVCDAKGASSLTVSAAIVAGLMAVSSLA